MVWKNDITNIRTWEIWREMQNNFDMSDEDIKNLPIECFWVAGLVQKIIRNHKSKHEVKPCRNAMFREIECLETDEQYGFFKTENDVRPSQAIWIDKDEAERLFELFSEV